MASLASINVKFSADLKEFSKQMQTVGRQLNSYGRNLQKIGKKLTKNVSLPLAGLGALAVKAAADMETLKTSLDTVFQGDQLKSSKAFDEIKEFAATTPFQLDEVATAFIKLKNLGLDPSLSALTSYGNTASALGKSLDQMIEAVADASVGEFERLKEFGIKAKSQGDNVAFTFQGVTTTVKKNAAEISEYLQGIGNVNFAGSIERQANTFKGRLSTLKDNVAQAFASIGDIIITYITPLFDKLNGIIKRFQELSPTTKKWIVILGGVAAAVGPLLALAGTILPAIVTGFTLLFSPVGAVLAVLTAIGVVIYKNWQPIKKTLIDIANYFIDLYNESTLFRVAVEAVVATFKTLWLIGKFVFEGLKTIVGNFIDNFVNGFETIGKIIKAVLTGDFDAIPAIIKEAADEGVGNFKDFTKNLSEDWTNLIDGIKNTTNDGINAVTSRKKIKFLGQNVDASAITDEVSDAVNEGLKGTTPTTLPQGGGTGSGALSSATLDALDLESAFNIDGLDEMLEEANIAGRLQEKIDEATFENGFNKLTNQTEEFVLAFSEKTQRMLDVSAAFSEQLSANIQQGLGAAIDVFGQFIGSLATGQASLGNLFKGLLGVVSSFLSNLGKSLIQAGLAAKAFKVLIKSPALAIAAGAALIALSAVVKNLLVAGPQDAGAFANGGIVGGNSFYGDRLLARVNSGELILNQRQQQRLYGDLQTGDAGGSFTTKQVIEGDKLILITERAQKKKDRRS